jgi:predicted SAM-dependent methyltransferase
MIETITYNDKEYPLFQAHGNAAQFAIPFAKHFCKGVGYDVGCGKLEWLFPGAVPVDPAINDLDASNLGSTTKVNYIFSSHCLEHLDDYVSVMEYWRDMIKPGGVLFLYLPDYSQEYWRPWNNRKHKHAFTPNLIKGVFDALNFKNVFCSEVDLNNSFMIVGER